MQRGGYYAKIWVKEGETLGYLPAAQLYPLNQGGSLILSSVMAAVFFKEKLTMPCVLGILTAFAGLLFINVL